MTKPNADRRQSVNIFKSEKAKEISENLKLDVVEAVKKGVSLPNTEITLCADIASDLYLNSITDLAFRSNLQTDKHCKGQIIKNHKALLARALEAYNYKAGHRETLLAKNRSRTSQG